MAKLYQPSNGTEGDIFMSQYCYRCSKFPHSSDAKNQCMIVLGTMALGIDDPEYPKQWQIGPNGPTCTAFKDREQANAERRERRKPPAHESAVDDLFAQQEAP